jgi:four helix bundle protein
MALAALCYRQTRDFPRDELFGLTSQIRRAAASIPANIAEGWGRESTGAYIQFLRIAQGSCKELETHAVLAQRVLGQEKEMAEVLAASDTVGKMLRGLIRSLQAK